MHACASAGDRYDGEFREGQEDGIGIFTWADGATYNGFWASGAKQGVGVYRPAGSPENKRATTPLERHTTQPAGPLTPPRLRSQRSKFCMHCCGQAAKL